VLTWYSFPMSAFQEMRTERLAKLELLKKSGMDPYPPDTHTTHTIQKFLGEFDELVTSGQIVTLAGRIMALRRHGVLTFADLFDGTDRVQAYLKEDAIGDINYQLLSDAVDVSDFIEVTGIATVTKRGEKSVLVQTWRMLAKSIRAVPDEWFGLKDEDERYRRRYLSMLLDENLRVQISRRSVFWNTMRSYLLARGFIEVETPVLETVTGGAEARPFVTHHNALDIDVYLRISAGELWQKRLLVAGFPKVFEIGRIFRNEGMSHEHLQDYTQLEYYEAYADYQNGMDMIVDLYRSVAQATFGTLEFTVGLTKFDLGSEWERYDFCALMEEAHGFDPRTATLDEVRRALEDLQHGEADARSLSLERGVDILWKGIRKSIAGPGFLLNVPVYLEPLAKRSRKDTRTVERFQVILAGSEVGKGFSELNDPLDQRERFTHQQELRNKGDDEAQMNDEAFVEALEYGMPPAFGFGVSERLFSFLANVSVREGQAFPLMRPK
jgi:lysyl-tRNA synthetase, class II